MGASRAASVANVRDRGKELLQAYGFRWFVAKESAALANEMAKELSLEALSELHRLPRVDAVNIVKPLVKPRHANWTSPFLRRNLVRKADAQSDVQMFTVSSDGH